LPENFLGGFMKRLGAVAIFALVFLTLVGMSGCIGSSTATQPIAVRVQPQFAAIDVSANVPQTDLVTAVVENDPKNAGVTFVLNGVGALSGATSGAVTYTAPNSLNPNQPVTVTIVATAVSDKTRQATAIITVNPLPVISTLTVPSPATIGEAYPVTTISTTGGTNPLRYQIASGALPPGLVLGNSNNQGTILNNPHPLGPTGQYNFSITVTDAANPAQTSVPQAYSITVQNPPLPGIVCPNPIAAGVCPLNPPAVTAGQTFNQSLSTTGQTVCPCNWSVSLGSLPSNIKLNQNTGMFSGQALATGTFVFTVQLLDVAGQSTTQQCSIVIGAAQPVMITSPATLPAGVVGSQYQPPSGYQLTASGGVPPYFWQQTSAGIPPGLSVSQNGLIEGTPSMAQTNPFSFMVQVQDSQVPPHAQTQTESITITSNIVVNITNPIGNIAPGATAVTVNATVTNDTTPSGGVTWKLQSGTPLADCSPTCGTITMQMNNPPSVLYTPPATQPAPPNNTPTLTATAVDDTSKSATDVINITGNLQACPAGDESVMNGNFAFLVKGFDSSGAVAIGGSFVTDGAGAIKSGTEDINRVGGAQPDVSVIPGGSSYSVGSDGRGCLTLQTGAGTVKFRFGLSNGFKSGSPKGGRIIEFDDTTGTGTRGSGIIRVQDTSAFMDSFIKNSYAFGLSGFNSTAGHFSSAGTFKADGIGMLTSGNFDSDNAGTVISNNSTLSGMFAIPTMSKDGRASTFNIVFNGTTFHYGMYVVNASELILVGIDGLSPTIPINSGEAISSIGPFNSGSLTGSHLIRTTSLSGSGPHATIGVLTFDGTSGVTGTLFDDKGGTTGTTTITPGLVTYAVDATTGRLTFTGLGANSPVAYIVPNLNNPVGITSFITNTDNGASAGVSEFQSSSPNFTNTSLSGLYSFGTDENVDNATKNFSGEVNFDNTTVMFSGFSDESDPTGLLPNQTIPNTAYSVNTDGTGNVGPNTVSVTNGTVLFFIDESSGNAHPTVTIVESQLP
jgi:hypothetical protein